MSVFTFPLRPKSLKTRMALALALVFASIALMVTWLAQGYFEEEFRRSLTRQQATLAAALAGEIDDKLRLSQQALVASGRSITPALMRDADLAQAHLDRMVALHTLFDSGLVLVTPEGRILAESPYKPGRRGRDIAHREFIQTTIESRQPVISRPFQAVYPPYPPLVIMTSPVFDAQGRLIGILDGSFNLQGHNQLADLQKIRVGETGYVSLFTRDRLLISHRDPARVMQPTAQPGQNRLLDQSLDGFDASGVNRTSRGVDTLSSFKQLSVAPWVLSVNLPLAEAEAPLRQAVHYFRLAATGGTLLVLLLAWLVMKRGLAPLEQLLQHVRALPGLPAGERQFRLPPDERADMEVGTLVQAFNTMVGSMQQQQHTLQESEARFRSLAEMSTDWYWEQDAQFRFTLMSQGLGQTTVTPPLGKTRWEMPIVGVSPEQWAEHRAQLERHEPFRDFVYRVRTDNGELRTFSISGSPIFDEAGVFRGYRGIGTDITERRRAEQRIEFLAYHDTLTGLPNRVLVQDRFVQALAQAERSQTKVALVYLDLDNFKSINDSLGHAAGDLLLKEVAVRLVTCVRDTDTISRQGGDEFLIVLRDLPDTEIVSAILMKIMDSLQQPFPAEGQELATTVSMGVAVYPDDGRDFDTLRKKADQAMYRSKEAGRNAYHFFDPAMDAEASEHLLMRSGLRRALDRREFVLHYQPQFDLASGAVTGLEALLRWQHPVLGTVAPGRFIAVAEESGLIVPMGDWVLQEACRQAAEWQREGLPALPVAVNLSAIQFKRGNVEASVARALADSGLAPGLLELELTESILIQNVESVLTVLKRLKQRGVKLAIDDFGTGYSSLSYLKRFDIDRLKIDQSFVRDLATDPDDAAIVRAIIQMADSLNLRTIAEGVETEEMRCQLRSFGCNEAQGFLYARPMPAADMARFLREQPPLAPGS